MSVVARGTPGFAGADLANLVNEAALVAARQNRKVVTQPDFELAKDKVMMGAERKSMVMNDEEKKTTAYHEAGHALITVVLPEADPLHKVTIIPRGMALGLTMQLPIDDKHSYSKEFLRGQICILMAGRIAEEIFLNQSTTGAGNDIERATELSRKMVCEWGMSEKMGPLAFGRKEGEVFLGRDFNQAAEYSESTAQTIDSEIKRIVLEQNARAKKLVEEHLPRLHEMSKALLEYETLDMKDINQLMRGEPLTREKPHIRIRTREMVNAERDQNAKDRAAAPPKPMLGGPLPEPGGA
jgi:cell division protease FtsH